MSQALRWALTVLLCGRTVREESSNRSAEELSVAGAAPLPAVPLSRPSAVMLSNHQPTPASYPPSEDHALSIALAQSVADQAAWQAARASGSQTHQLVLKGSAGEALPKKFWQDGSLAYSDVVTDGFYEIYGDFPEVCEGPHEFPSLEVLRKVRTGSGDVREVVLVHHEQDQGLLQAEEMLSEAMAEANPQDVMARIRVVAHVVCDRFGGTYDREESLERFWQVSSANVKRRNRSAVLLLCQLDVGSLRHRALLFKVLADAVKLPCKVIRGQALCGADSAANAIVMVDGREHIVDLVFDPGKLISQDQFAAMVQERRLRLDAWHHPAHDTTSAAAGNASAVEASAASASSATGAPPAVGTVGSMKSTGVSSSSSSAQLGPVSSGVACSGSGGQSAVCGTNNLGASLPAFVSAAADAAPVPHSSPRGAPSRTQMLVPPVPMPAPAVYSSSLPAPGMGLHVQSGAWVPGPAHAHGSGPGPAIAGSRVRFTITDLPKTENPQPQGGRGDSRQAPLAVPPFPAPPHGAAAAAGGAQIAAPHSGRHSLSSLPGKAKSMLDLAVTVQRGGDCMPSGSGAGCDLIRLDSEPLPDSLHDSVPPPERSGTPTGTSAPGPRGPPVVPGRRQNSFDQNGWVKFSGSFTRSKDDSRTHTGGPGLSPLSQSSGGCAAGAPAAQPGSFSGSQTAGGLQPLEMVSSFPILGPAEPSPDGTKLDDSVSSSNAARASSAGSLGQMGSTSVPPVAQGASRYSTATNASAFANFQLPSDLSATACSDTGCSAGGSGTAGSAGASGSHLSARIPHGSSEGSPSKTIIPPQQRSGPQALASQQQQLSIQSALPQPPQQQARSSLALASPFHAMQMGFASHMPPASLVSAFGAVPPTPQPGTITHVQQPTQQQQQQQAAQRPPQVLAGAGNAGTSTTGANLPLPRMGSLPHAGQPQAPSQQQPAHQQQPAAGSAVRQYVGVSHDSAHRMYGLGNGAAATIGGTAYYATPPKSADGIGNAGSKAPSPALSTPFTAPTASSAQSTPPGSAPGPSVPFADLSPFNVGEATSGCGSDRKAEKTERERDQREREQRDWERGRERDRERELERDRERDRAQSFFADLSPFRVSLGPGGETRDATPARQSAPGPSSQPIVETPSSDNSRETTPRVSITNITDTTGGVGSGCGGADGVALDLSRIQLGGQGGGRPDPSGGRPGTAQQQQIQIQQGFGSMPMMGPAAVGGHLGQQLPHHVAMSYYAAAAMQGNPYMYMQPSAAMAAAAAAMMPQAAGFMHGPAPAGAPGMQGWRHVFNPAWESSWTAAQQSSQYMLQAAYLHHQQRQHQQAILAAAAGMAAQPQPGGALALSGIGMPVGGSSTVAAANLLESGTALATQTGGPGAIAARPPIASGSPQLALPPSIQPQLPQTQPPRMRQQQQQQKPPQGSQGALDLAHEMTVPSARRMERSRVSGAGDSDATAEAGLPSPLGQQPSLSASMPLPPSHRDLEINPEDLTFGQRIGMGSFGEVYRGTWRGTNVAIKHFHDQNLSPVTIREFRDEVLIMSKLRHPNIVLFLGAVTQKNQLAIVTQYMTRGSLFRMLHRNKEVVLDPRRRLNMALDIAKGMEYLHNCKPVLVHRDLKSPNLLVDKDWTVKVCDFGLSRFKNNTYLTAATQNGSPAWMAPETLKGEPCDEKSDVFSFGVILYELVTGKEPWEELNPMQVVGVVGFSGRRMDLPTDLDPAVTNLIQSCWATNPKERPSFTQILATMNTWSELRPTAAVLEAQRAKAPQRNAAQ